MTAIYLGIARQVTAENGAKIVLRPGCTVRGELGAWLVGRWPDQFREAAPGRPDRLSVDVQPGAYVTK